MRCYAVAFPRESLSLRSSASSRRRRMSSCRSAGVRGSSPEADAASRRLRSSRGQRLSASWPMASPLATSETLLPESITRCAASVLTSRVNLFSLLPDEILAANIAGWLSGGPLSLGAPQTRLGGDPTHWIPFPPGHAESRGPRPRDSLKSCSRPLVNWPCPTIQSEQKLPKVSCYQAGFVVVASFVQPAGGVAPSMAVTVAPVQGSVVAEVVA